ncbi:MAG: S-layer homology domain-containing protein [Firmicutes bacterium]|nr:S-layer homology domain-containing protein [Bacillota bacterium]
MKKRMTALLISAVLLLFCFAAPLSAGELQDIQGPWAEKSILRWTQTTVVNDLGAEISVLEGLGNSKYEPDSPMTRAQLAKMITAMLGLTETAEASAFADMTDATAWYYHSVLACAKAGIMQGIADENGNLTMEPQSPLTREQAFTMIARAFCITLPEDKTAETIVAAYSDRADIGDWALPSVAVLCDAGAVVGYGDGTLKPDGTITRAEIAKLIDCLAAFYMDAKGNYSLSSYIGDDDISAGHLLVLHRFSPLEFTAILTDGILTVEAESETTMEDGSTEESFSDVEISIENGYAPMVLVGEQWKIVTEDEPVEVDDADLDAGEYASIK